jgi:hypothetical protein
VSLETAMAQLGVHLAAAGTAVTPQILDVERGAVVSVPARLGRYWYAGNASPAHYEGRQTLTTRMVGRRVTIAFYWPVSDRLVLESLDAEIAALEDQVYTRILGDCQLGGACDDLDLGDSDVEYPVINGQQVAELIIPLVLDFGEAYTISA